MSEENLPLGNPLIYYLVSNINAITECLNNNNTPLAHKRLINLMNFLDPKIKKTLEKEIHRLQEAKYGRALTDREFSVILNRIVDLLYEGGYFSPQQSFRRK